MTTSRRALLKTAAAITTLAGVGVLPKSLLLPAQAQETPPRPKAIPWRNWSGGQYCEPSARVAPANEDALVDLMTSASGPVRPVGAGHSFTGLVPTDGTIVALDRLSGIESHNEETLEATIWAGTRLSSIGEPLAARGQAMQNMPDIDRQTLAGSISTSTHGTGITTGSLSSTVTGLRLITPQGDAIDCDARNHPEIFKAAQVSLGGLGIVSRIRIQNRTPFKLKKQEYFLPFDEALEAADELRDNNRSFEMYYITHSGYANVIIQNETEEADTPPIEAAEDSNDAVFLMQSIQNWTKGLPWLRQKILDTIISGIEPVTAVAASYKIFPSERRVRFNEMEYHIPMEDGLECLAEVKQAIANERIDVFFPIEFRYIKGDDIWLSPFQGGARCSIAVHRYFEEDYKPYFSVIEPIFRKYGGRPHWGKLHSLTSKDFELLYPNWHDYLSVRAELDPNGRMLNPHLKQVFGIA